MKLLEVTKLALRIEILHPVVNSLKDSLFYSLSQKFPHFIERFPIERMAVLSFILDKQETPKSGTKIRVSFYLPYIFYYDLHLVSYFRFYVVGPR